MPTHKAHTQLLELCLTLLERRLFSLDGLLLSLNLRLGLGSLLLLSILLRSLFLISTLKHRLDSRRRARPLGLGPRLLRAPPAQARRRARRRRLFVPPARHYARADRWG